MAKDKSNKEVVLQFSRDVFVNHDLTNLDECMRDDYIQHNPDCPQGKAGFVQFFTEIFAGVPDFKYTLLKIVAEGDLVFMYSKTTGTHAGTWLGMPATSNRLDFNVVDIFRMEDGLIAEHWDVADTLTLFTTIGKAKIVA
jgi:predicted SnoaL-like aldol condensation-catalyzing enzyme